MSSCSQSMLCMSGVFLRREGSHVTNCSFLQSPSAHAKWVVEDCVKTSRLDDRNQAGCFGFIWN
ncbi:MAG: hypothetical protein D9V45_14615 [Chloroflexi bacterium]|nr:MAG: hypothetical protein D9V45_14615 [Chloroflexota bacterium]